MDELRREHDRLAGKANYSQAIDQVQALIDQLSQTRQAIASEPAQAPLHIAKVKTHVREGFDRANDNLKQVNTALKAYEKGLAKIFKTPLESPEKDALARQSYLINRAIALHLMREGQFDVANIFFDEVRNTYDTNPFAGLRSPDPRHDPSWEQGVQSELDRISQADPDDVDQEVDNLRDKAPEVDWEKNSHLLQQQFLEMYSILHELRVKHNLDPAIQWAKAHSALLDSRGSNLEFELCRLRFIAIFSRSYPAHDTADVDMDADHHNHNTYPQHILEAASYAREAFGQFRQRYSPEIHKLLGAMAYWQNITDSPYAHIFATSSAWDDVCNSFTREFCSLLGMASSSPLYVACTAGSIALPRLSKFKSLTKSKRTEWTTEGELPVEIPLPPNFRFHSIFVCPVSKEQSTDDNPPTLLPCGHVICFDSMRSISKGSRFKCPYCPQESNPKDARKVFL